MISLAFDSSSLYLDRLRRLDEADVSASPPLSLDDLKADEDKDDVEHEIVGKSLKDAVTAEDAQWQEIQIDGFFTKYCTVLQDSFSF